LLEKEVLSSKEIESLLNSKKPAKTKKPPSQKRKKQTKSATKHKRKAST
jgi:hypothetical protein